MTAQHEKLVEAVDAAIKDTIRSHDMGDHALYMMGDLAPSDERRIIAAAILDALAAKGFLILKAEEVSLHCVEISDALAEEGMVIVPREPTREMVQGGMTAIDNHLDETSDSYATHRFPDERTALEAYRAMVAARPGAKP